ncbi:acetyl-CoA synthetase-like protein [Stipitochalara longipes BDJ]|nr:acetyl-CoA synthetase-like protein [Stipitochalara longipes BDJ]
MLSKSADVSAMEPGYVNQPLWRLFTDAAQKFGDIEALVALSNKPSKASTRWTYRELIQRAERLAGWLYAKGCRPRDYVIGCFRNSAEYALFYWAAARLNMTFVPLNAENSSMRNRLFAGLAKLRPYVLIAHDEKVALALSDTVEQSTGNLRAKICCDPSGESMNLSEDWTRFHSIDLSFDRDSIVPIDMDSDPGKDHSVIVFTSGTTSGIPKGCPHTASNLWSQSFYRLIGEAFGQLKICIPVPVYHVYANVQVLSTWRHGGTVVFPSEKFDVFSTIDALQSEECTNIAAVRTIMEAIESVWDSSKHAASYLTTVNLAAEPIAHADLKRYKRTTKAQNVVVSYGMSECGQIAGWPEPDLLGWGVGRVHTGVNFKICNEDNVDKILPVGQSGILHINGPSLIHNYFLLEGTSTTSDIDFYDADDGRWFNTGDQAVIQAIGIADSTAGQQLFGIVPDSTISLIESVVGRIPTILREELGWKYGIHDILSLSDIGLDDFPRTAGTRKIQKALLQAKVMEYLNSSSYRSKNILLKLADLMHISNEELPRDQLISETVDSIDLLRLLQQCRSTLGHNIGLKELGNLTVGELLQRLEAAQPQDSETIKSTEKVGVPQLSKTPEAEDKVRSSIDKAIQAFNFQKDDIDDLYPVDPRIAFAYLNSQRTHSYYSRAVFLVRDCGLTQVRETLHNSLASWPIFRTFSAALPRESAKEIAIHVSIRPQQRLWELLVDEQLVENNDAVMATVEENHRYDLPVAQMFHAKLVAAEKGSCVAIVTHINHSVMDLLSIWTWARTFECILQNSEIPVVTDYKSFADASFIYRQDPNQNNADVEFNLERLRELPNLKNALWPKQPAQVPPGTGGFEAKEVRDYKKSMRIENISSLRGKGIPPSIIVKAAIALLNSLKTRESYAVFNNVDEGRSWHESGKELYIADINGPTHTWFVDVIELIDNEPVLEYLQRVKLEHDRIASHVHAPFMKLFQGMNEENRALYALSMKTQTFNWDASARTLSKLRVLEHLDFAAKPDSSCFWNCTMLDDEHLLIKMTSNLKEYGAIQMEQVIDELLNIVAALSNPSNLGRKIVRPQLDRVHLEFH